MRVGDLTGRVTVHNELNATVIALELLLHRLDGTNALLYRFKSELAVIKLAIALTQLGIKLGQLGVYLLDLAFYLFDLGTVAVDRLLL